MSHRGRVNKTSTQRYYFLHVYRPPSELCPISFLFIFSVSSHRHPSMSFLFLETLLVVLVEPSEVKPACLSCVISPLSHQNTISFLFTLLSGYWYFSTSNVCLTLISSPSSLFFPSKHTLLQTYFLPLPCSKRHWKCTYILSMPNSCPPFPILASLVPSPNNVTSNLLSINTLLLPSVAVLLYSLNRMSSLFSQSYFLPSPHQLIMLLSHLL